jgi:hypothetical protein
MILRRTSLAALLDVPADELLRVLLEDLIDLVEQLVDPVEKPTLRRLAPMDGLVLRRLAWIVRLRRGPT